MRVPTCDQRQKELLALQRSEEVLLSEETGKSISEGVHLNLGEKALKDE